MMICWSFSGRCGPVCRLAGSYYCEPPGANRRNATPVKPASVRGFGLDARVPAEGVVGEFEVVALADEHPERAVPVARCLRRCREAARQQLGRGSQLAAVIALRERGRDQL